MKILMHSLLAVATIAGPIAATSADAQRQTTTVRERRDGTVVTRTVTRQPTYRDWRRGQRFDRRYARNYRQVDWRQYRGRRLYAPPRGHQWVRSGNDAVLIAVGTGLVAAVLTGALR
jgi:Ni/Co efflux regulator RcnB